MTIEEIRVALGNLATACYKANAQLDALSKGVSGEGIVLTTTQKETLLAKVKADFAAGLGQAQAVGIAIEKA